MDKDTYSVSKSYLVYNMTVKSILYIFLSSWNSLKNI